MFSLFFWELIFIKNFHEFLIKNTETELINSSWNLVFAIDAAVKRRSPHCATLCIIFIVSFVRTWFAISLEIRLNKTVFDIKFWDELTEKSQFKNDNLKCRSMHSLGQTEISYVPREAILLIFPLTVNADTFLWLRRMFVCIRSARAVLFRKI